MDNLIKVSAKGKTIIKKENDKVKIEKATEEEILKIREASTLCFDCENLSNCEKVDDKIKKTIDKYDFISDGAQVIDKDGNMESFLVSNCKDFVREAYKDNSGPKVIEKRRNLKMNFFGVETIEEANRLAEELAKKNAKMAEEYEEENNKGKRR